jgi:hypothetical protein
MKRIATLLALLLVMGATVFAQGLTIICNQSGAQVFVSGRLMGTTSPNITLPLKSGSYALLVSKSGFQPFNTTVSVTGPGQTITVNLIAIGAVATPAPAPTPAPAATYALTVNSPTPSSQVFLNGASIGTAPVTVQVAPGTYTVLVKAPNRLDWSQQVQITNGPVTVTAGSVAAQPVNLQLTVSANVNGASVAINGATAGQTPFTTSLPAGSYTVVVSAPGYGSYSQNVVMNSNQAINATLQQQTVSLQVQAANAPGAAVLLNGNQVGSSPYNTALPPGTYSITIRSPGFLDYNTQVNLSSPQVVSVSLQQQTFTLQVQATNAPGAAILINGNQAGSSPFNGSFAPGNYSITIRAPGFTDYNTSVSLNSPQAVSVALQQAFVSYTINIPAAYLGGGNEGRGNDNGKGNDRNAIQVYVDNMQLQPVNGGSYQGMAAPGRHQVRIVAGGLKFESSIDLQAGRSATFEPSFVLNVK